MLNDFIGSRSECEDVGFATRLFQPGDPVLLFPHGCTIGP